MVFIPFWGFGGGFEAHAPLAFTTMLDVSSGLSVASTCYGKTPLPAGSAGAPMISIPQNCQDLPIKQAQIELKKAKEE
jgi:hypothetical protein